MKLFDADKTDYLGPRGNNQDAYDYYNRSSRVDIGKIRLQIEQWFQAYPEIEKEDLKNTFKNNFDAGFFELFLYTLFYRMGYKLTIHPAVPNSKKTPDFLLSGFGHEFYLEAKVSYYESEVERSSAKRLNSLYEMLDKADIKDFFIYLKFVEEKRKKQPSGKKIKQAIEARINSYDVEYLYEKMNNGEIDYPIYDIYEDDDIYIEYGPIPKSPEGLGKAAERAIGVYGEQVKILENVDSLRRSLKMKSKRYSLLDKPYLIAINAIDMIALDANDVLDCLTGTTCFNPELINETGQIQEFRKHDGFFTGQNDKGQNKNVSAAFITKITPWNWRDANYWIHENQKARHPISLRESSLITRFIDGSTIYRTNGQSFGRIIEGVNS